MLLTEAQTSEAKSAKNLQDNVDTERARCAKQLNEGAAEGSREGGA